MFRLMLQKITHKKWMILCLLIGNILLIAVAVCHPMYQHASGERMLTDEFEQYKEESDVWPGLFSVSVTSERGDQRDLVGKINQFMERSLNRLDIPMYEELEHYALVQSTANSVIQRSDAKSTKISIGMMTDFTEHTSLLAGEMYTDSIGEDGCLEAVVTQSSMVKLNLLIGEELEFPNLTDEDGNAIHVRITGVIGSTSGDDPYWVFDIEKNNNEIFISETVFRQMFMGEQEENFNVRCNWYQLFDYTKIKPVDVSRILKASDEITNKETFGVFVKNMEYQEVLKSYNTKAKTNDATLTILQSPLLILLCAFLFMIARQMLSMEQNEISLMKSRGAKRIHIIFLYFLQSIFLTAISLLIALPLGRGICKLLGSATDFLEFSTTRDLNVVYDSDVFIYAFIAIVLSILMTVLPVIKYSGVSIVHLKQSRARAKHPLWQKLCLDFICLGIAYYGYYSFSKSQAVVMENILTGNSLDPLLYLCSSLFILGAGFLFLRIQPWIIRCIYKIFKRRMGSVGYSSYLSAIRSGGKQQFIMMFMILTVALGIFHATVARTILNNAQSNLEYLTGADFIVQEVWADNSALLAVDPTTKLEYIEPDYSKYETIDGVKSTAQVYVDKGFIKLGKESLSVEVMGIVPKEFSAVTTLEDDLLYYNYSDYLNVLASDSMGVLVSANFMTYYDYRLGDTINFKSSTGDSIRGIIRGFLNYWPTYASHTYSLNTDGSLQTTNEYLIVANLGLIQNVCGVTPYQVWMNLDNTSQQVYDWVEQSGTKISYYEDLSRGEQAIKEDNLFQGTNGILTLSFIIILILCAVGYLIYWIMSIRSRELLFGVLRAMGMGKAQIIRMLINEQIFSGFSSILAGAVIGYYASYFYVPMIQYAYASANQVLPLKLVANVSDIEQLFLVITVVLLICLVVLARIVAKMNITKALKLGED